MIHYHGSPFGGSRQDAARFFTGRHGLVPYPRPDDIGVIAEVCQSFALDNGAYSIWRKGGTLDYNGYIEWVENWHRHPAFDWAIIPDIIGGSEKENDLFLERWETKAKGVPVYHIHEPLSRLKRMMNKYEWIAIGSSGEFSQPNYSTESKWFARMSDVMDAICDENGRPACKLHGLRMLNYRIFSLFPLSSADSTNAVQNNNSLRSFGMYVPPTASQRAAVIAERIESHSSAPAWLRSPQLHLEFEF